MSTIQELEQKVEQLEKDILAKDQKLTLLTRQAEKAIDYATHAYRVDHYGFIWVYNAETKLYNKTEMRLHTPEVPDKSIGERKLQDNSVTFDKLAADVRNRIESSLYNIAITPEVINRGSQSTIQIDAFCFNSVDSIHIKRNGIDIAVGSGTSLSYTDAITPIDTADIVYTAEFISQGVKHVVTRTLAVAQPIYYGAGTTYKDATSIAFARTTPKGEYPITIENDGSYIFFVIPTNMTVKRVTMNGITMPMNEPVGVLIDGQSYKAYQSTLKYDQFSETVVLI